MSTGTPPDHPGTSPGRPGGPARGPGPALVLLAFAQLVISVDYNIVYVALPQIGSALGFTAQSLQWVVSAYAVAFGGALLLGGRACDLYGPRRMFVLGLSLYAASSLAGGLATGPGLLIAARAVQGIGGAFLFPATLTLVATLFAEGRERNRAYSVWGAAGGSGLIVGALLGGVLTQFFGWRAVLFVNVPSATAAAVAAFRLVTPDPVRTVARRIDLPGALTSTAGVTALVLALVQGPDAGWTSPTVATAAVLGLLLTGTFLAVERHSADPLMPLRLLRCPGLGVGMAVTFLYMATIGTGAYFLTVYFQDVLGYDALRTGLAYLVPMFALTAGSLIGGRAVTRWGTRTTMTVSLLLGAAGTALTAATMSVGGAYTALVPGFLVLGLGQGAGYTVMFGAAAAGAAPRERGIASGMASTTQQVGGAIGLAVLVGIANSAADGEVSAAAGVTGVRAALFVAAAGTALTALVALRFPRGAGTRTRTEPVAESASVPRLAADPVQEAGGDVPVR
ncbi:MFS transporter [Streptomyces sp. GC420]|uniref:MFS transporter n=1 Tax=Streptomyces sp. GC420 TaxID=2697568 RepID=UPI0014151BCD|nr:MFS transporter [Streptomyces sp. GC420]NBM16175.1 MFS transporter [Streptomyces sp. GC420]